MNSDTLSTILLGFVFFNIFGLGFFSIELCKQVNSLKAENESLKKDLEERQIHGY